MDFAQEFGKLVTLTAARTLLGEASGGTGCWRRKRSAGVDLVGKGLCVRGRRGARVAGPVCGHGIAASTCNGLVSLCQQGSLWRCALTSCYSYYLPRRQLPATAASTYAPTHRVCGTHQHTMPGPRCCLRGACRAAAGREVREHLFEQVSELLHGLDEGMVPISVLFPYLPIPPHFKRDK